QLQPQKPAVGDVDFDLTHQLPFGAHTEQVADEQRLEHQRRIERGASVVRAVKSGNPVMDKRKVDHRIDLAKQVILRNQTVETYHLQSGLLRRGFAKHATLNQKSHPLARTLSAVWGRNIAALPCRMFAAAASRSRVRGIDRVNRHPISSWVWKLQKLRLV